MILFSFELVYIKPGFCKRITDTANPIVVTIGGGVNRPLYGYAGFVDGFGRQMRILFSGHFRRWFLGVLG